MEFVLRQFEEIQNAVSLGEAFGLFWGPDLSWTRWYLLPIYCLSIAYLLPILLPIYCLSHFLRTFCPIALKKKIM